MGNQSETAALIAEHLETPDTQWSLGTFGGIAEFSRDRDEEAAIDLRAEVLSVVTPRGGIRLSAIDRLRPFASESIGRRDWNQRVALCLPEQDCAMNRRHVLTEVGPDEAPLREQDRGAVLFDLGLDALQTDLCVRIADPSVVAAVRPYVGSPAFDHPNPVMGIILAANPHRVFLSRAGRAEVYQPIPPPGGRSPEGPHTHVLLNLLSRKRTHPATEPVPAGFVPCAHFYPPHPVRDEMGLERLFDRDRYQAFHDLLARYGSPDAAAVKAKVAALVVAGKDPASMPAAGDRDARANVRVALRQLKAAGHASSALTAWLAAYDPAEQGAEDDDAQMQGH